MNVKNMNLENIQQALQQTFDDHRLSRNEKYALQSVLEDYREDPDTLSYARNCAFDIVRHYYGITNNSAESQYLAGLKWLERVIKVIDSVRVESDSRPDACYFSPGDDCLNAIIGLIRFAKRSIDVCVFTISDDRISKELAAAFHRNVELRVITDNDKSGDRGSDVAYLAELGVAVKMDISASHMHHKFALFDGVAMLNGSFNWTRSASQRNAEDVVVSYQQKQIAQFANYFDGLWSSAQLACYE